MHTTPCLLAGFWFQRRSYRDCYVVVDGEEKCFVLQSVNEFNSTRKRMSCVVQTPEGKLMLFVKGADNVMFERMAPGTGPLGGVTKVHLRDFANEGLRTLVIAEKELTPQYYEEWNQRCRNLSGSGCGSRLRRFEAWVWSVPPSHGRVSTGTTCGVRIQGACPRHRCGQASNAASLCREAPPLRRPQGTPHDSPRFPHYNTYKP